MRAVPSLLIPVTVTAAPGFEDSKLMQRFAELDARNQRHLLETALALIERQQDAQLLPHERAAKRHIWTIERTIELLHTHGHECDIQSAVWRGVLTEERRMLAAMGRYTTARPGRW